MPEGFLNEPRFTFGSFFIERPYITILLNVMYAVRELHILSTNKSILGRRNRYFINKNAGSSKVLVPGSFSIISESALTVKRTMSHMNKRDRT